MLKALEKIEYRQLIAIPYLMVVLGFAATNSVTPWWKDLDGSLGLFLAFVPAMIVPRRWLWTAFLFLAAYFGWIATVWLLFALHGESNNGYLLPAAFFLAAVLLVWCAVISKRKTAEIGRGPQI